MSHNPPAGQAADQTRSVEGVDAPELHYGAAAQPPGRGGPGPAAGLGRLCRPRVRPTQPDHGHRRRPGGDPGGDLHQGRRAERLPGRLAGHHRRRGGAPPTGRRLDPARPDAAGPHLQHLAGAGGGGLPDLLQLHSGAIASIAQSAPLWSGTPPRVLAGYRRLLPDPPRQPSLWRATRSPRSPAGVGQLQISGHADRHQSGSRRVIECRWPPSLSCGRTASCDEVAPWVRDSVRACVAAVCGSSHP
jgi:hypothetical protein